MKITVFWSLAAAGAVLVGCQSSPSSSGPSKGTPTPTATTPVKSATPPTEKTPTLADLPANLKTDAYEYYGLGSDKPVDYSMTMSTDNVARTGTQTYTLKAIKPNEASFTTERTGGLSILGDEQVALRPDGVYILSSDKAKITGDKLDLPSGLTPGRTWTNHQKLEMADGDIDLTITWKVKGEQDFDTKLGKQHGLYVTAAGSGDVKGSPVKVAYEVWMVKGVGEVKTILTTTRGSTSQKITYEEAKPTS